jgi:hypothetical protein
VSVVVGKKTLFLFNIHDPDNPIELAFQVHIIFNIDITNFAGNMRSVIFHKVCGHGIVTEGKFHCPNEQFLCLVSRSKGQG